MVIWLIITAAILAFIVALLIYCYFCRTKTASTDGNCFMRMVCTGTPQEAPLSEQQKHDILRQDFHPTKVQSSQWDAIVIGSGLSGLSTAKILAASNRKVLVLEQHDRAGGACHTFDLDRFEFDVGLHYVTDMGPDDELYKICSALTESQAQWHQNPDPFDVIIVGDKQYGRKTGGPKVFSEQLKEWFPEEKDKINAYFKYIQKVSRETMWMFRLKFLPTFIVRFLLSFGLFDWLTEFNKYAHLTLQQTMQQFHFSEQLQIVCAYYCANYGIPPNRASFYQHWLFLMHSSYFPIGGTPTITSHIVRSIEKFGGKVLVKANVNRIVFENGKVKGVIVNYGVSGCFIESSVVISTVPLTHLFNDLIPPQIAHKSSVYKVVKNLSALDQPKVAAFQAYIGLIGSQEELKLPTSNYFYNKNNGALDIDIYLRLSLEEALEYGCPPFIYLTFPSAKDPKWGDRHPGVSTCQMISITNPEWFEAFKDKTKKRSQKRINKDDYLTLKNTIGEMFIDQLIRLFPNLKNEIVFTDFSTSLSQQYYMQNSYGELYSLAHTIDRFKPEFWSELRHKSDIPGLYLSGQDLLFCGVSSALSNGLITAGAVLGRDLHRDLRQAYRLQTLGTNKSK